MHPRSFRLASLTLETIERERVSMDSAFQKAIRTVRSRYKEETDEAYLLVLEALRFFPEADLVLRNEGLERIPLRRRCAFRVAYAALRSEKYSLRELEIVKGGVLSGRLWKLLSGDVTGRADVLKSKLAVHERLAVEYSTPPWLVKHLLDNIGFADTLKVLRGLWKRTFWVRVITTRHSEEYVLKRLRGYKLSLKEDRDFPYMYEILNPQPGLTKLPPFKKGLLIAEDKGSAAVVHALNPSPSDVIYDAAAAPGVKTSHIHQLTGGRCVIVAGDISRKRVQAMRTLMSRMGVDVMIIRVDSTLLPLRRKFDKVLVDAPCTNSGALSRDPGLRLALWKKPLIDSLKKLQVEMLRSAFRAVKPGGIVVYSTCSLLASEGEEVVAKILEAEEAELSPSEWGVKGYKKYPFHTRVRRLYPHIHRTVGFFIARFKWGG